MGRDDFNQDWQRLSEEILSGLHEWRVQHPQATLCQIETAIDDRLTRLRTKLLQDAALATPAADWTSAPTPEQPRCPQCQIPLHARGQQARTLQTHGGRDVVLTRSYGVCPACAAGFFPPR